MQKIKEITLFTNGDSKKLSTWSNVPYFFSETLIAKGIKVNRVDLNPEPRLEKIWKKTMGRFVNRLTRLTSYDYFRSLVHYKNVKQRIKKAIICYPNADVNIFMTFSFSSAGMTKKPTVLFCDWTYDHHFKYHVEGKPGFLERLCLNRENAEIEAADLVIPLFPGISEYMKSVYKNKNIFYLGNVINSNYDVSETEALNAKKNSLDLLFVGSNRYMEGAMALVKAFENLKDEYKFLKLHIIGIEKTEFKFLPDDVFCYGYLDKANEANRTVYYDLFRKAKMFINTTPKWGAFSAAIEAMYFYVPIIVTPYEEFVKTFGKNIDFGVYCEQNLPAMIETNIKSILNNPNYNSLCLNAHNSVKEYTWSSYIDKVVRLIEGFNRT